MAPLTPTQSSCSLDSIFDIEDDLSFFLTPPQQKRKRVRINTKAQVFCHVEHISELTPDDKERGWWSKDEYEATKQAAKSRCRELRRRGTFKGCLTDAYEQACTAVLENDIINSISTQDERLRKLDKSLAPPSTLMEWCKENESSRGLERWSSKVHGFLRGKHVGEAKHAILLEQARQFLVNQRNSDAIAYVAVDASKRSRAFARLLGEADALAAKGYKRHHDGSEENIVVVEERPRKARKLSPSPPATACDVESDEDIVKSPPYVDFDSL